MSRHACTLLLVLSFGSSAALQAADIAIGSGINVEPQQSVALPISLARPAPDGGVFVTLSSSDTSILTVRPSAILIPAGSTVPYSRPQLSGVNFGSATISATAYGMAGDSQVVRVSATLIGPSNATMQQGNTQSVTLSLSTPAPSSINISLSSENPGIASVPAAATIPAGGAMVSFAITGGAPGSTIIHAGGAAFGSDKPISVSVTAPGVINIPVNLSVNEGQSTVFPLTLSTPAPPYGVVVNLSSSDPARVTVTPSTVLISGGAVSPGVQPNVNGLNIGGAVITATAPGYQQVSQTVAVPATLMFSPANLSISGSVQGKLQLALSASAPWGIGLTVQLASSNPGVATVQPTINFYPDGSAFTTSVVIVTPQSPGTTTITASVPPYIPAVTAFVTVAGATGPPASISIASGNLQSATVNTPFASALAATVRDSAGNPVQGATVTFTAPAAGAGGFFTGVTSTTAITSAAGIASSGTFIANSTPGSYSVTGGVTGVSPSAAFTLTNTPASAGSINLSANVTTGPSLTTPIPLSLSVPAPAGGATIALTSSNPAIANVSPASVFVAGSATAPSAPPQVTGVNFGSVNVTATAAGYSSASQLVQVTGSLSLSPATLTIRGTGPQSLMLALSTPAPAGGLMVSLASSNPTVVSVAPQIVIGPGVNSVSVSLTATNYGAATITANTNAPNVAGATASLTVQPTSDISVGAGVSVEPGESTSLPLSLAMPAPAGGVYVSLTSTNTAVVDVRPSLVVIPEGATVPARLPQLSGSQYGSATVSASAYGFAGDSQTVLVAANLTGPSSAAIDRGATQSVTFVISKPAPAPLAITVTSDNPGVASVPSSVTIPANQTAVFIPVTGTGTGSTIIRLGGPLFNATKTLNVTVVAPASITIPGSLTVNEGQSAPYPVTLGSAAPPYGVNVTLTSSDPALVSVSPSMVFVPGGSKAPASQPQVNGLNIGSAMITAAAPGYLPATQTVAVPATVTFSPANLTIVGSSPGKLLLALSASAPWGIGLTVQLTSSDPSVATVEPSINFYPDGSAFTTVVVVVTPHAHGTAIIKAGAAPFISDTTATVTVQ